MREREGTDIEIEREKITHACMCIQNHLFRNSTETKKIKKKRERKKKIRQMITKK
jgi:hypothetical protein